MAETGNHPPDFSMIRVLVSACLLGERVRYDGRDARCQNDYLSRWAGEGRLVPFCPEVAGGFAVPRRPAEIQGGDGRAVLEGRASVRDDEGRDVTALYLEGALRACDAARAQGARVAVLKDGSPSCGSTLIADGTFSGTRRPGAGVTAGLLEGSGIRVFSEHQLDEAAAYLLTLES
jgi:uncharacterized protein YbbK (DUF523 family)